MTPPRQPPRPAPGGAAFSLIEVLIAVAISGLILVAASQFLVSISRDWSGRDEERYFAEHVDGVVSYLQSLVDRNFGDARLPAEDRFPVIEWPEGYSELERPMVRFRFIDGSPLFTSASGATGPVTGYFGAIEEEGLVLFWVPDVLDGVESIQDYYRTLVSPWLNDVRFIYYDAADESWVEETELRGEDDAQPELPERVILKFKYAEGIEVEKSILLPKPNDHVILY